jgi:hypothetical protein
LLATPLRDPTLQFAIHRWQTNAIWFNHGFAKPCVKDTAVDLGKVDFLVMFGEKPTRKRMKLDLRIVQLANTKVTR